MENGAAHSVTVTGTTRAASPLAIALGLVLLGHAVLVLAGVVEAAVWVPILECVAVCVLGLSHLRRVAEAPATAEDAAAPFGASVVPARVAGQSEPGDRVARTGP